MDKIENILLRVKYHKSSQWLQVRNLLLESIREFPENLRLKQELADLYMKQKLFTRAIKIFQEILEITTDDPYVYLKAGNCFLFIKEYVLAIDYYEKSQIELPEIAYNKAYALSKIGDVNGSIKIMRKVLDEYSFSEAPFIFLSELYFNKRQYDKALKCLKKAENQFGRKGELFYLKGLAYYHKGLWLQSYFELHQAERMKVENYQFYRNYGLVCEKIGKTEEAIKNLLKSIKLSPSSTTTYMELIKIYLTHDLIMEAYTIIQHAKRNVPFSISLSILYNQILQRINKLSNQMHLKEENV
ncbi:tetratricopeptide repeat protein [Candidatus Cloacimonadota bacterium]